ncbi:MAG TPA: ABC transporter substrate-binding protein [Lachnospiraceae bacterium]|nr:ABC transporter substrate-binding protein [Lachnospiraceae bacterium]
MKTLKQKICIILALSLVLSTTACGSGKNPGTDMSSEITASTQASEITIDPTQTTDTDVTETVKADSEDFQVTYPVTVTDHLGREVIIEKEPQTIVSGYYISTSLLIALGMEDRLTGVEAKADKRAIYKLSAPEIVNLPNVGSAKDFDLEGCAALSPDLVILPVKLKDAVAALEELGITVLAVKPENQELFNEAAHMIATATNTLSKETELVNFANDSLNTLADAVGNTSTLTVYLAGNSSLLSTAPAGMYQNTLIVNAGGSNVAAEINDTYWAEVSYEQLLSWNPDVIILASDATYTVDSVLADSSLAACKAVKEGRVYQIPGDIEAWDSPVPGSFLGSLYMASVLHPTEYSTEDYENTVATFYKTFYDFEQ